MTSITKDMKRLVGSKPEPRNPLTQCIAMHYTVLVDHIPKALAALNRNDPKDAIVIVSKSVVTIDECKRKLSPEERKKLKEHLLHAVAKILVMLLQEWLKSSKKFI
ncbi:hypothetical protein Acr_24g0000740 [Actinidia rufa]|uniref:Uncharacterized protein n=1 Tax=Actinidia rufa TaxID=165716 RepID=A0A7J0GTL4_9ERIC|nr:hypothetical protein Acr_24g0000740 [Actinidia rufa]